MARASKGKPAADPITWETVRELAGQMPEATESTSYGTPAFKVRKKLFVRLHQSGEAVVIHIDPQEREMRMKADPAAFFITDHYLNYPYMLVRLSAVRREDLQELLIESWRSVAPQKLVVKYDEASH